MFVSPRWRKVVRDIWDNKARTILVVLAIAVGVFAFGGVFITQEVLITEMNSGYQSIHPASITMGVNPLDEEVVRSVASMRYVEQAEGSASYSVQLLVGDNVYITTLYAVSDYENVQVNQITSEQGQWPPQRRQILFERTNLPFLNAEFGDMVTVELPDGSIRELEFAGTIHDFNANPANLFPVMTGYVTLETLEYLGHPGTYNSLNIVTAEGITDVEELEEIGNNIKDGLERDGYFVGDVNAQDPSKHWAADVTQAFTAILGGIGAFALILSGFLVINTISAVLTQQKRQIGMMKAVGASSPQVIGIYLVMVLVFGILALVVALPLGWLMALLSTQAIAGFLNLNIANFHMPFWVLLLEVAAALIAPLLAAIFPIIRGTQTSVREAVSDYGIGTQRRRGLIEIWLAGLRGLPRPTLLSLRNTFRRKGRLVLTVSTLTLAGSIFIAVLNVRGSLLAELDSIIKLFNYDIQVILDNAYPIRKLVTEAVRVEGVTEAEGWAFAQVTRIRDDGSESEPFIIFGPPADTPFVEPTLLEGRWIQPTDQNAIVLSSQMLRDEPDIEVGDEIVLKSGNNKRRWQVVGIVSMVGTNFSYANFDYLSRVENSPGRAFALFVGTEQSDQQFADRVAQDLEDRLGRAGIGVAQYLTTQTIIGANVSQFNFLIGFMLVMAIFLALVGGLGLTGTMSLNVLERTREIGVMRAIGASDGSTRNIVVTEGITIGIISWMLGSLLSIPVSYGFSSLVGNAFFERPLPFSFSVLGVFIWLVLVVILSSIASLLPARRASQISVRESLAYE